MGISKKIYHCKLFKINDLQGRDKLSVDIATYNFILILGFNKVRLNNEINLRKPERSYGNLPSLNLPLGLFSFMFFS